MNSQQKQKIKAKMVAWAKSAKRDIVSKINEADVGTHLVKAGNDYTGNQLTIHQQALISKKINNGIKKALRGKGAYGVGMIGSGSYVDGLRTSDNIHGKGHQQNNSFKGRDDVGTITMERRELVTAINATGSAAWTNWVFSINPGLQGVFPSLSQLAMNFEEYDIEQLLFEFESVISSTSVNAVGSLGNVVFSVNYNAAAKGFSTAATAMESSGSTRGTIANKIFMGIECDKRKVNNKGLFVRAGAVPSGEDQKSYDHCTFQVGLDGVPTAYTAGTRLGLLWVRYKIKLRKPIMFVSMGYNIMQDFFYSNGGTSTNVLLGTTPLMCIGNNLGGYLKTTGGQQFYILPDNFSGQIIVTTRTFGTNTGNTTHTAAGNLTATLGLVRYNSGLVDSTSYSQNDTNASPTFNITTSCWTVLPSSTSGGNTLVFANGNTWTVSTLSVVFMNSAGSFTNMFANAVNSPTH